MNAVIQSFNTKNFTFEDIHKTIVDYILTTKFIAPFLISFNATVKDINGVPGLVGRELFSSKNVTFLSTLVDPTKIQKLIKIFTVILAFSVIFNYYGWKSINSLFTSMQPSLQLSPLSISLHATFDFAHTVFVTFKIPATSSESYLYLIFVVSAGMLVYVFFENTFSVRIHAIHTVDQTTIPFWIRFLSIIALHSCFIATHYYILENLSQYPLLSFITISSPFLPQIIYTFFNSNARKKDNVFIINELISKSIIILYYGFISNHIYKKIYPREASIAFGLLVFQAMLVILQNQFGSHLCFPDFLFAESYDYYQPHEIQEGEVCPICFSPIEIDDEVMVTPCEHAFHAECLQRWMEEELVCPMCRANLPPLR
ncbi:hypothetical protein TVAG_051130 [Trichomonas vaginalis G3]|uniref:RING-type domain-containing protein n=1 Tax=Trichomonas vaginalis (strain ATCC PRA-98 / G3) TaxID=412133 RepID=A2EES2_TRIV3|nr:RING finger ubiquitin ligase family [Trichomonas vaginalis G3]EAY08878.1 hypothetical protein TVAG_051130 [Trichomonas vaginalis G3]KAI5489373.1 RING finger ubiquitin ligase family [Trichomonas vaginalis G3]|eukprot:XP_001321101.1 hypothetical protein [Trichomonas vaginalis G3]